MKLVLKSWVPWLSTTIVAVVAGVFTMMAYAHGTFVTQREIDIRLSRIEKKIDAIGKANGIKMKQIK